VKAYLVEVLQYIAPVLAIAMPAALVLYPCQIFVLPALGVMWVGLDVVFAFCVAVIALITMVRVAFKISMD
jgi:hypothetical protein